MAAAIVSRLRTGFFTTKKKKYWDEQDEKEMDDTGVEPVTFCLQGRRATNYARRPFYENFDRVGFYFVDYLKFLKF